MAFVLPFLGKKKAAPAAAPTTPGSGPIITPLSPDAARQAQRRPIRSLFNPQPSSTILSNTLGG